MIRYTLRAKPEYIPYVADVYMQEWAWHYADDWNINTRKEMVEDLAEHYLDDVFLAFDGDELIGTYAVLDADLKSHASIGPWLSCLYVLPRHRNRGHGTRMVELAMTLFLWCYTEKERSLYLKAGFRLYETIQYKSKEAWILVSR